MEKKIRKVEIPIKATDAKPKDRGDSVKASRRVVRVPNKKKVDNETQVHQEYLRDRGDGGKKPVNQAKFNTYRRAKPEIGFGIKLSGKNIRKIYEKMNRENAMKPFDLGRRKELLEMYTFRKTTPKSEIAESTKGEPISGNLDLAGELKSEKPLIVMREEAQSGKMDFTKYNRTSVAHVSSVESTLRTKKRDQTQKSAEGRKIIKALATPERQIPMYEKEPNKLPSKTTTRKPIIKTVTNKNDSSKIYKAVTFEEEKKTVPLRISLNKSPLTSNDSRSSRQKSKQTLHDSLDSFKSKTDNLKAKKRVRATTSPCSVNKLMIKLKVNNKSRRKRLPSPEQAAPSAPMEVAKWAPMSVNTHTKPYYEAWVNTTLAAISRNTDEKLYREKQEIIRQMQRAIDNPPPPEEEEDFADEKYTGRIRVHNRLF